MGGLQDPWQTATKRPTPPPTHESPLFTLPYIHDQDTLRSGSHRLGYYKLKGPTSPRLGRQQWAAWSQKMRLWTNSKSLGKAETPNFRVWQKELSSKDCPEKPHQVLTERNNRCRNFPAIEREQVSHRFVDSDCQSVCNRRQPLQPGLALSCQQFKYCEYLSLHSAPLAHQPSTQPRKNEEKEGRWLNFHNGRGQICGLELSTRCSAILNMLYCTQLQTMPQGTIGYVLRDAQVPNSRMCGEPPHHRIKLLPQPRVSGCWLYSGPSDQRVNSLLWASMPSYWL